MSFEGHFDGPGPNTFFGDFTRTYQKYTKIMLWGVLEGVGISMIYSKVLGTVGQKRAKS